MKLFFGFFLLCILHGCNNKPFQVFEGFPREKNLSHKLIESQQVFVNPQEMVFIKDALIVLDGSNDFFLHAFDSETSQYLGSYIRKGRGPDEETQILSIRSAVENKLIYKTLSHVKTMQFDPEFINFNELSQVELTVDDLVVNFKLKERLVGWGYLEQEKEFIVFDSENNRFSPFGPDFPSHGVNLFGEKESFLHANKQVTVHPNMSRFAAVYMHFPILRIYSGKDGKLLKERRLKCNQIFPGSLVGESGAAGQGDVTENYWKVASTKKYIFALFSGKTRSEKISERTNPEKESEGFSNVIHVWDWDGNPVKKLILDKEIFLFAVANDGSRIVASCLNSSNLLEYILSWD